MPVVRGPHLRSVSGNSRLLDLYAWHYGNSDETYQQVGQKGSNPWGIFDMHGNVAEWTLDEYSETFYEGLEGPSAEDPWNLPTRLHPRTVRGGAYDDSPEALRCGARLRSDLDWKRRDPQIPRSMWWNTDSPFVGFRIVRPFVQPTADGTAGILGEGAGRVISGEFIKLYYTKSKTNEKILKSLQSPRFCQRRSGCRCGRCTRQSVSHESECLLWHG